MALRLTSTTRIDPRYDGHRTTFGSAFSHFLKIRTDRNTMIWKQRLKDANPQTLMKMENEIQDRIYKLHSLQRDMQQSDMSLKQKLILAHTAERSRNWRAMIVEQGKQTRAQQELRETALNTTSAWAGVGLPQKAVDLFNLTEESMLSGTGTVTAWYTKKAKLDNGEIDATGMANQNAAVANEWVAGLALGAGEAVKDGKGPIAADKFYMHAYGKAATWGQSIVESQGRDSVAAGYVYDLRRLLIRRTNQAAHPGGRKDVMEETKKSRDFREMTDEMSLKILDRGMPGYGPSSGLDLENIGEYTGGKKAQESIQKSIDALTNRLAGMSTEREDAAAEYQYLLRGGGMHMGLDPVSYRPSRTGSRMDAYRRMYAAEPNLAETQGRTGDVTFDKGTGGNLSDFLKARIGKYRDSPEDKTSFPQLMDEITAAVKSYGTELADDDDTFDTAVTTVRETADVVGLKALVADWESQKLAFTKPKAQQNIATIYLAALADENSQSNLTRNYAALAQGEDDEANRRVWEHNARVYPARTNVSVVLNPRIDRILNARDEGNREEMYNGMTDLYTFVSQPGIDDLLGSAGTNIRGALEDMQTSAEEIGAENALERTARQIQNQQVGLAEQRRDQDPGLFPQEG